MKKFLSIILCSVLLFGLTACGSPSDTASANSSESTSAASENDLTSADTASYETDEAAAAGADLFEIVPEEVYTNGDIDWTDPDSRVSREHDDEALRDVPLTSTTVENWDSYDTVFISYPIWWAIAAWPVDNFVKDNDFSGKTVIPFATSATSGMGQSGQLLADMAGSGDWQEGQRFRSGASADDVQAWVSELGL